MLKADDLFRVGFSSGQVGSKIWLCDELEKVVDKEDKTIWIYGGWIGLLSFLLFVRSHIKINLIRSFDVNEESSKFADLVNNLWEWDQWKFKAFATNINSLDPQQPDAWSSPVPSIIINTATEHVTDKSWWKSIPLNTLVVLQSNNMKHPEHVEIVDSVEELESLYPMGKVLYSGELSFDYGNDSSFTRYMLIGHK